MNCCQRCNQLTEIEQYDDKLWDIYHRISDGRSNYEPLIFNSDWLQENVQDDEDHDAVMHAMSKDMRNRGLCPNCGRPDLRGVTKDMILSHEDVKEMNEMHAEQRAERRAGC